MRSTARLRRTLAPALDALARREPAASGREPARAFRCLSCGQAIRGVLAELGALRCHDCGPRATVQRAL